MITVDLPDWALENETAGRSFVKQYRTTLLQLCDWTQLPDAPVDAAAWAAYRQTLRDFPASWTFGPTVTFPDPPA